MPTPAGPPLEIPSANWPRPFLIRVIYPWGSAPGDHKAAPATTRWKFDKQPKPQLFWLCISSVPIGLLFSAAMAGGYYWAGVAKCYMYGALALAWFVGTSSFLAFCWHRGRMMIPALCSLITDGGEGSRYRRYILGMTGGRDVVFSLITSFGIALVFIVSVPVSHNAHGLGYVGLAAAFAATWALFLPLGSGLWWIICLPRMLCNLLRKDKRLNINPLDPCSAKGIDRVTSLITWAYWGYLCIAVLCVSIWYTGVRLLDLDKESTEGGQPYVVLVTMGIIIAAIGILLLRARSAVYGICRRQSELYGIELWDRMQKDEPHFQKHLDLFDRTMNAKPSDPFLSNVVGTAVTLGVGILISLIPKIFDLMTTIF